MKFTLEKYKTKTEIKEIIDKFMTSNQENFESANHYQNQNYDKGHAKGYAEGYHDGLLDIMNELGIETDEEYYL